MKIGSIFNYKLKKGIAGRRQSSEIVQSNFSKSDKVIWMHAASLGEYEQGVPVLQKLKASFPNHKILITFFSPSGYDNVINKKHIADAICYLPFDCKELVKEFTSHFETDIFFTVKYDYWYNLLEELRKQKAKIFVVSALFYETQVFFKPYGSWFKKQLAKNVDWFFHQTKHSTALAKSIGLKNSSTAGDTRFDRVKQLTAGNNEIEFIYKFIDDKPTIVFGSSWEAEEHIAEIIWKRNSNVKIIMAPHDLRRVAHLKQIFPNSLLYSQISETSPQIDLPQVLIVDSIGLLSRLYSYADLAVVGGGFHSAGLHNILEAATFGIPVFFGNHYKKNPEADELIKSGGGKSFEDEFFAAPYILGLFQNEKTIEEMGTKAGSFVHSQPDATHLILSKMVDKSPKIS